MSVAAGKKWQAMVILAASALTGLVFADQPTDRVLAEIGGERITLSEFLGYFALLRPQGDFAALPSTAQQRELDEYLERRLLAARARELGLDQQPQTRHRIDFLTDGVLAEALRKRVVRSIEVSEQDLRRYYDEYREEFWVEPRLLIEHLVFRDSFSAQQASEHLSGGATYADLIDEGRRDPELVYSRRGWVTPMLLIAEVRDSVLALELDGIASMMKSNYGFHVVRLVEKEEGFYRPFEEVQQQLTEKVQRQKAAVQHAEMLDDIRAANRVHTYLEQLREQGAL